MPDTVCETGDQFVRFKQRSKQRLEYPTSGKARPAAGYSTAGPLPALGSAVPGPAYW
jgi:hypothetical protein